MIKKLFNILKILGKAEKTFLIIVMLLGLGFLTGIYFEVGIFTTLGFGIIFIQYYLGLIQRLLDFKIHKIGRIISNSHPNNDITDVYLN